jgi:hypothetical protein
MTDTVRSIDYLLHNEFRDGQVPGSITPQRMRDLIVTVQARTMLSLKQFGAIGDGRTDDTKAIQAAFDALYGNGDDHTCGGDLYIPAGDYRISDTITIGKRITVVGEATRAIFRAFDGFPPGKPMLRLDRPSDTSHTHFLRVHNLRLDGRGKAEVGIYARDFQEESILENVGVDGCTKKGIFFESDGPNNKVCENWKMRCIHGYGSGDESYVHIHLLGTSGGNKITDFSVSGSGKGSGAGIRVDHGICSLITGHVENCADGIVAGHVGAIFVTGVTGHSSVTNVIRVLSSSAQVVLFCVDGQGAAHEVKDEMRAYTGYGTAHMSQTSMTLVGSVGASTPMLQILGVKGQAKLWRSACDAVSGAPDRELFHDGLSGDLVLNNAALRARGGGPNLQCSVGMSVDTSAGRPRGRLQAWDEHNPAIAYGLELAANGAETRCGGPLALAGYSKAQLPPPNIPGSLVFVHDAAGGAVVAFSDGANWRRTTDRSVIG